VSRRPDITAGSGEGLRRQREEYRAWASEYLEIYVAVLNATVAKSAINAGADLIITRTAEIAEAAVADLDARYPDRHRI